MLVSVVIPIYNVKEFLDNTLKSVQNQTYRNLEVLMVNDGSTDNSPEIAQKFANADPRFKLIHQENKGLAGARNTGLKNATGDYLFYLDSDDYISEDCIETLMNIAQEHGAECVQANIYYDFEDHLLYSNWLKGENICYSRETAMMELLKHQKIKNFAWGNLVKMEVGKQFEFPDKNLEDTFWKYKIIHSCTKFGLAGKPMLYYLQRGSSISGTFRVINNLDQLEGEEERLAFLKEHYPPEYYHQALKLLNHKILLHRELLKGTQEQDKIDYLKILDDRVEKYNLNKLFSTAYLMAGNALLSKLGYVFRGINEKIANPNHWVSTPK